MEKHNKEAPMMRNLIVSTAIGLFLLLGMTTPLISGEIQAKMQAILFKKILSYDKKITKTAITILVVGSSSDMVDALKGAGFTVTTCDEASVGSSIKGADAVYITASVNANEVKKVAIAHSVLSLSGPAHAESGDVSIGLGVKDDGRPQIIVHLGQVKAENHDLSADLLALAKVIK